jgi:O-antigen/teichoic acid export membrane protein
MKKIILVKHKDPESPDLEAASYSPDLERESLEQIPLLDFIDITDIPTAIVPAITLEQLTGTHQKLEKDQKTDKVGVAVEESQVALLSKLVKSSGVYALSSIAVPLIGLVLSPFLTHHLSLSDYGALAITNTAIGLAVGLTQLNLASAFVRAYIYEYSTEQDRSDVVATVATLLCLISIPVALIIALLAPQLADLLFGHPGFGLSIALAGGVVLLQNLTVPGLSMLRSQNRPLPYSLLSLSNLLVTLFASLFLVGALKEGIEGAIIANGLGYACIVICTLPRIFWKKGIKVRLDMTKSMLAYGLPLVLNFISYWILQLLDRYLLSLYGSLAETAKYTVAYTLGSVISVVIISPFTLAWPTLMFSTAKRADAQQTFKIIFRWLSMILLFTAFALSFAATVILKWLFPVNYYSAANVIPFVAGALVFYGLYFVFMVGVNIRRMTWLAAVFMTIAAVVNVGLNLVLIPSYGAVGAAAATLIGYAVLALVAYIVNQKIYPVPFELGRFGCALLIGAVLYAGCDFLSRNQGTYTGWGIHLGGLVLYGGCLVWLGKLLPWKRHMGQ